MGEQKFTWEPMPLSTTFGSIILLTTAPPPPCHPHNLPCCHLLIMGMEPPSTHSAQLNMRASQGAPTLLTSGMRPTPYVPLQPLLQSTLHHFLPQVLKSLQPDLVCSFIHLTGTSVSHYVPGFISPPCPTIIQVRGEFSRE